MAGQLHILQHALGLNKYGQGNPYRNHYVCGPGHHSYEDCRSMVAAGLMVEHPGSELTGGDACFSVTQAGKDYVRENSPKPPKLTRSQQRYRHYLDVAECYEDFHHFLVVQERERKTRALGKDHHEAI